MWYQNGVRILSKIFAIKALCLPSSCLHQDIIDFTNISHIIFLLLGWLWGDPHFVTLDGKNYTFNGLGEYIMTDARDGFFQLQARTKLAKGGGTATVFSAAAAKEGNSSVVQVELNDAGQ